MAGKAQQIVILQGEVSTLRAEVARWQGLYEAVVASNVNLQAQVLALAGRELPAEGIIREVMAGFKAVMAPDPALPTEPADLFSPEPIFAKPDPAWEIPEEWGLTPDGMIEADAREAAEDGQ